jgi:hypothetical protein
MADRTLHIVSFNVPDPPDYGGVIDVYYRIKSLRDQGVDILLHCFKYGRPESKILEGICKQVFYYYRPTGWSFHMNKQPFIVATRSSQQLLKNLLKDDFPILFEGLHTTYFIGHPDLASRKKIVRTHNIEHEYYSIMAGSERSFIRRRFFKREAKKLKRYEKILPGKITIAAINKKEEAYYKKLYPSTLLIHPFHPFAEVTTKTGRGEYILFHGNLSVPENIRSFLFLYDHVFKDISFRVIVAGKNPVAEIKRKTSQSDHMELISNPDEQEMIDLVMNAQVNIIHSFQPAGIKLKLLTALFAGRFCIANEHVMANTGLESLCHMANTPEEYIRLINTLMDSRITEDDIKARRIGLKGSYSNGLNAVRLMQFIW